MVCLCIPNEIRTTANPSSRLPHWSRLLFKLEVVSLHRLCRAVATPARSIGCHCWPSNVLAKSLSKSIAHPNFSPIYLPGHPRRRFYSSYSPSRSLCQILYDMWSLSHHRICFHKQALAFPPLAVPPQHDTYRVLACPQNYESRVSLKC